LHGGVVDYVFWHCGFDFAVFNFADVMIDVAVVLILLIHFNIMGFGSDQTKEK
jgi:signal peptidase II